MAGLINCGTFPMLIAHLSDIHLVEQGRRACGVVATGKALARLVACLNRLEPRPDVVLITGDLTHDGSAPQVDRARELLAALHIPWLVVPGNHDDRGALRAAFANDACPAVEDEFLHYTVECHAIRLIGLDSTVPGAPGGAFCDRRAAWLEARLAEAPQRPTILFLHHPPVCFGVPETDEDGFADAGRLGAIVARFPAVERILCGHIHLHSCTDWRGTPVVAAPSGGGMELTLNLGSGRPSGFYPVNPAFLLHLRAADGGLVTHRVELREDLRAHAF